MCQPSWDRALSLSTDWRWDLEEKLLLLCLLYGSFFTLNAENLCRGHRIPASLPRPELIFAALGIDKAFSRAEYAGYVLHLSSLYFPAASLLGLVQPVPAGLLKMSSTHAHTELPFVPACPYLRAGRLVWLVIRDSIARRGHKTPAFMARLLSFCLQLQWLLISPYLPCGPHGALNRLHFTNGKLSRRCGGVGVGVYKYVKYTFNYIKWIWQLINKEGRDKHTSDTGHCGAAGKR